MASKIDLTLLKKLVEKLESSVNAVDAQQAESNDRHEYIVELSKCMGLAMGVAGEASALVGDMKGIVAQSFGPSKEDTLAKLLGVLGQGGLPGSN